MTPKQVKNLIAEKMNDKKKGISVSLGEIDLNFDRILIKYPKTSNYISLNPIRKILTENNFYIAQICEFWDDKKRVVLICRGYKK